MEPEKKEPTQPTPAAEPKETKDEKSTDEGGRAGALEKATDEVDGEYLKPNWD
jgi:hypothetical protein